MTKATTGVLGQGLTGSGSAERERDPSGRRSLSLYPIIYSTRWEAKLQVGRCKTPGDHRGERPTTM